MVSSTCLMHYGVKGMKWGIRHEPNNKSSTSNKKQSIYQKWLSDSYQAQYRISKSDADQYAKERTKALKKILIGTAVVSALLVGYTAYTYNKHIYADEILKKGTTLQSLQADPSFILKGEKFYASHGKMSNQKYLAKWSEMGIGTSEYKQKLTAIAKSDMRLAGRRNAAKEYHALRKKNLDFKNLTDKYSGYTDFNINGLAGKSKPEASIYGKYMTKKGFAGVHDINDRHKNAFNVKADIYFGNKHLGDYKVSDINPTSVRKANNKVNGPLLLRAMSNPYVLVGGAEIGAVSAMRSVDKRINKKIEEKRRY